MTYNLRCRLRRTPVLPQRVRKRFGRCNGVMSWGAAWARPKVVEVLGVEDTLVVMGCT